MNKNKRHPLNPWWWMEINAPEWVQAELAQERDEFKAENERLKAQMAEEREQVCQFIRDMYTGRFAAREEYYWELPQWIRDAIEADPIYSSGE